MAQVISSIVVVILIAGFLLRANRGIHIRLMALAIATDLSLVLALELNRSAIRKATTNPSPLLIFHVAMSVIALASYAAMAALGNATRGGNTRWRGWHRACIWRASVPVPA